MVQGFQNKSSFVSYYRHESKPIICSTSSITSKGNLGRMLMIENNDTSTTSS